MRFFLFFFFLFCSLIYFVTLNFFYSFVRSFIHFICLSISYVCVCLFFYFFCFYYIVTFWCRLSLYFAQSTSLSFTSALHYGIWLNWVWIKHWLQILIDRSRRTSFSVTLDNTFMLLCISFEYRLATHSNWRRKGERKPCTKISGFIHCLISEWYLSDCA